MPLKTLIRANLWLALLLIAPVALNAGFAIFQVAAIAQSVLSTLTVTATNPTLGSDANFRRAIDIACTFTGSDLANTGFTTDACEGYTLTSSNGQNVYGGGTDAKRTYTIQGLTGNQYAAGQRFLWNQTQNCYGMGDCFIGSQTLNYATADNVGGDEGIGIQSVSYIKQQGHLTLATVSSVPTPTTCNTTITQAVTGSPTAQAVTVASTANCVVNDWVVIGQVAPSTATSKEALQITAVGGGAITGIFRNNHANTVTVTPAKVLVLDSSAELGQQRALVNLSGTTYSTGTVSSITGGGFTGSGTTWANNMVGGTATNIGCVQLTADDFSGAPFNGSGASGTLKSWYEITSVASATSLGILTYSTAGDSAYHGNGVGSGGYSVKPCAEILFTGGTTVVLETTSTIWSVGNSVEVSIAPYPDVTGYQYQIGTYTPGGAGIRALFNITNIGARTASTAINITQNMPTGGGAQTTGWSSGINIGGTVAVGLGITNATQAAISLLSTGQSGDCTTDNCGKITWGGSYLMPNSTNGGMDWQTTVSGAGGLFGSKSQAIIGTGNVALLNYTGMLGTTPVAFSTLPTCAAGVAGAMVGITDSNTATFNATITGGGANKGIAYCDGANWKFH